MVEGGGGVLAIGGPLVSWSQTISGHWPNFPPPSLPKSHNPPPPHPDPPPLLCEHPVQAISGPLVLNPDHLWALAHSPPFKVAKEPGEEVGC